MDQRIEEFHPNRADLRELLVRAVEHVVAFRASLPDRPVLPQAGLDALRKTFGGPLPSDPTPPEEVLAELVAAAEPGLMGSPGPRFFGFVVGGTLPAAMAADMLAVGWDQNAFNAALAPAGIAAEEAAGAWLKELLHLPTSASVGFVTGAQAANTVGLVTARHHVLVQAGWDVERRGLGNAPEIRVVVGEERHATIDRSVRLVGIGTDAVATARADRNGAMDVADLERVLASGGGRSTIVCLQVGNVNTGACDDLRAATELVHRYGGWVHVDGAFGLWAAASPAKRHLVDGIELADSWACDAHKWLNVPYDSAFAITSRPEAHAAAMSYSAPYLTGAGATMEGADYTAESSRRSRGFAVWAALRELGREGVAGLVERCCALAERFADGVRAAGFEVVNDVVLNQVLVGFGDDSRTDEIVAAVQRDGTCWLGATNWRCRRLMRISVSNHLTTETDVDRSVAAITRVARSVVSR